MRTLFPKFMSGLLIVALMSCEEDPDKALPDQLALIQFQSGEMTISEGSNEGTQILLTLDRATTSAGTVTLTLDEDMRHRLQTNPAHIEGVLSLPVAKGVSQLQFNVKAIDNALAEGNQVIVISIVESDAFILGEQKTFQLIVEDDETNDSPVQSTVSFAEHSETVIENETEPIEYNILFTPAVAIDSKVVVEINSPNTDAFVTNPVSENNRITLNVPAGTNELSFTLQAINNAELNGHTEVEFTIVSTEGSVVMGSNLVQDVTIKDDELVGKLKSYEINAGENGEKRTYEYDTKGRISKIITVRTASHNSTALTDTYFYDEQDRVIKINKWLGRDILYTWTTNRIDRADVYQDGELIQYANYAYDDQGNLAGVEPFYKQPDGSFKDGGITVYLYFTDGNLYKSLTYNSSPNQEVLWTTRTYDQYLSAEAPIAMVEVLPNVDMQKKLAGSYRFENHATGQDETYSITYEFMTNGLPSKRTASAAGDTQITVYTYY